MIGSTREKESTSPRITEYFKAEEPSIVLKEKEETTVGKSDVKVSSGEGESCTEVEKNKIEQRDSIELKPQAKVIKNDDTSSSHKPPESLKTTTKPLKKIDAKPPKVASDTSERSKPAGRRKRKTTTTSGTSDSDFAPSTSSG